MMKRYSTSSTMLFLANYPPFGKCLFFVSSITSYDACLFTALRTGQGESDVHMRSTKAVRTDPVSLSGLVSMHCSDRWTQHRLMRLAAGNARTRLTVDAFNQTNLSFPASCVTSLIRAIGIKLLELTCHTTGESSSTRTAHMQC